jgi:hypothetical protein
VTPTSKAPVTATVRATKTLPFSGGSTWLALMGFASVIVGGAL